jgi:CheY-like chemotaxis protein
MNILFLDDSEARHVAFKDFLRENYPHFKTDYVYSAKEAQEAFAGKQYDMAFLDHDLNDDHYNAPLNKCSPGTGYDLAKWMKTNKIFPAVVVIHSYNHFGAKNMMHCLSDDSDVYVAPFSIASFDTIFRRIDK